MPNYQMMDLNIIKNLPTPCYVVDISLLKKNLELLKDVIDATGCHILLAQKAFSMYSLYPLIGSYLSGTASSGLHEAMLGYEEMGKENHVFSPAYREDEFDEILKYTDHVIFNSFRQWEIFGQKAINAGKSCGIRINPQCSTQTGEQAIYDPCSPGSRMGTTADKFPAVLPDGITGLHFHTLCEQNSDALDITLKAVEEKFAPWLKQIQWLNFGGGHHITREDYDIALLKKNILYFKEKYNLEIYLEPGEAVVLNTGFLVTEVLEIMENGTKIAILDTSAACHMPDVLEMPYRPPLAGAGMPDEKPYTYRLGGPTCLAGDIIGDYSFDTPLKEKDRLVFEDMALYTMVKNNTFNGMNLPSICTVENGEIKIIKSFGYSDFKERLS